MREILKKSMQALGKVVEKVGGQFQKGSPTGGTPGASWEGKVEKTAEFHLPEARVRKVLEAIESKELASLLPNLSGKKVIHATASTVRQWEALKQKGASTIVDFDVGPLYGPPPPSTGKPAGLLMAKGSFGAAPFPDESFEFLVLLAASARNENILNSAAEITRILKDGSRLVVSFTHPYLEHLNNPRSGFPHGLDTYFMGLRKAGLYVEEIKEAKADESVRSIFGPTKDDKEFAMIKGLPMVVFFRAVRLKRK